jgi:hypothetical protein
MLLRQWLGAVASVVFVCAATAADAPRAFLRSNDVVAMVGGSDVAAAQLTGHLETLLALKSPGTRFRNFGWEGDTVFAQPRDVGFPTLTERLRRAGVSVMFLEFGRAEALTGKETVPAFFSAYEKLLNEYAQQTPRIVLVTPAPFESGGGLLPDLSKRNGVLAAHANAIRTLARQRTLAVVDLFAEFGGAAHEEPRLTDNGLQITSRGHELIAAGFARQLGFVELAARAGAVSEQGVWSNKEFERLRQLVIEKGRLWFNYSRPQNWAFLGGDRTSQPSSRDHRNPNVRWFPAEMEKYGPLIRAKEVEIEQLAAELRERK